MLSGTGGGIQNMPFYVLDKDKVLEKMGEKDLIAL